MATSSKPQSKRAEQRAGARDRILETASRLIAERGFAATSISAIVEESGLPPTSIYWHFDSKEGLLAAVIEMTAARWFESVPRWEDLDGSPRERLARFLDRISGSLAEKPEFLRMLLLISLERREIDPAALAAIRRVRALAVERIHGGLLEVFAPLGAAEAERVAGDCGRFALSFADGSFLAHQIDPEATDLQDMFALLRAMLVAYADDLVRRAANPKGAKR